MKASQCEDFPHQQSCLSPLLYLASRRNAHKFRVDGGGVLGKVLVCLFPPSWHLFLRPLYHEYGWRARREAKPRVPCMFKLASREGSRVLSQELDLLPSLEGKGERSFSSFSSNMQGHKPYPSSQGTWQTGIQAVGPRQVALTRRLCA